MPNRILKESICTSDSINNLAPEEEVFFYRLIVNCDDYGRFDGRTSIIRSKCFPLKIDRIDDKTIARWIKSLVSENLVKIYVAIDGKEYLEIVSWEKHQQIRTKKSKYPEPARYIHFEESSYAQLITETTNKTAYANKCYKQTQSIDNNCNQMISNDINTKQQKQSDIKCNQLISNDSSCQQSISNDVLNPNPNTNPNNKNNIDSVTNVTESRTGSDERTCVTEEHRTSTTTQEKKLEDEQGMAVTSEPEQVTDTEVQPETNNNALITSGEEELEQLLEEFFEDGNETAKNHETAKIEEPATATGECERKKPSVPVEVPEDQETAESRERLITTGVELEDSGECNILQQDQDTAITQDHLIADEEEEIEKLLEEFFAGMPDQAGAPTSIMPTEVHDSAGDVPSERVQTGYDNFSPPGSQQEINTDGTHTVSNSGVATAVASRDAPACAPVNTSKTEDYQEEPVEKAPEVTNQDLIGILTHKFHEITKPLKHRSDYSYIGGLYNKFNYFIVDSALDRLKRKVERDGPMDSMKSYRAYLTRVCMNINQECVNPAGAQKERKQYSKARTLKVSTEEIKKQIETQATLF